MGIKTLLYFTPGRSQNNILIILTRVGQACGVGRLKVHLKAKSDIFRQRGDLLRTLDPRLGDNTNAYKILDSNTFQIHTNDDIMNMS